MKKALKYLVFTTLVTLMFAGPQITHGSEENASSTTSEEADALWNRWLNAKVVYRPDGETDAGRIDLRIGDLPKPEKGRLSLNLCGEAGSVLSIFTGTRTKTDNRDIIEIYIDPMFMYTGADLQYPVAIYWYRGNWAVESDDCDYIENQNAEQISQGNFYQKWGSSEGHSKIMGYGTSALHCAYYKKFTFVW